MMKIVIAILLSFASVSAHDTRPSAEPYGSCDAVDRRVQETGHWCKKPPFKESPLHDRKRFKYGRQTTFTGPLGIHKGWCQEPLKGSEHFAAVAISTKYIPMRTESPHSPYCGACVCVQVVGTDETTNPYPPANASHYFGTIIKGKVIDLCPECGDDQIDILADRPYTYAPTTPDNPKASAFNSVKGRRAIPTDTVFGVGIWKVQWNFVGCAASCDRVFA
jgi:hypothetical protein